MSRCPEARCCTSRSASATPRSWLRTSFPTSASSLPSIGDSAVVLHLFTADADALWHRAIDNGAEVVHPLDDQFWGDRQGQLRDPYGHKWNIAQHVRDVPAQEIAAAAAAMFGGS